MENNQKKLSFQLLAVITTPRLAEKTAEMFKKERLPLQYRFNAEGTASSDIMDMLGLGSVDKCLLISMIPRQFAQAMLRRLHAELDLNTVNSGIAFTIPLNGVSNLVLKMMTKTAEDNNLGSDGKDEYSMSDAKHALVAAIVNRGFCGDVMEAAKSAGARGGTVIHSRQIGNEEITGFWGLTVHEEKELVLILTDGEHKLGIMRSISEKCGMNSDAKGIVISMPVDSVFGI